MSGGDPSIIQSINHERCLGLLQSPFRFPSSRHVVIFDFQLSMLSGNYDYAHRKKKKNQQYILIDVNFILLVINVWGQFHQNHHQHHR